MQFSNNIRCALLEIMVTRMLLRVNLNKSILIEIICHTQTHKCQHLNKSQNFGRNFIVKNQNDGQIFIVFFSSIKNNIYRFLIEMKKNTDDVM